MIYCIVKNSIALVRKPIQPMLEKIAPPIRVLAADAYRNRTLLTLVTLVYQRTPKKVNIGPQAPISIALLQNLLHRYASFSPPLVPHLLPPCQHSSLATAVID